jgi:hypothetical protein
MLESRENAARRMKRQMFVNPSAQMRHDIIETLRTATARRQTVQISQLAEEVRRRHVAENIAVEDIEELLVTYAQVFNVTMEFDSAAVTTEPLREMYLS